MDELLGKMESANINPEPPKSEYETLYKNWGKLSNQEERRKEILEVQKCQRNDKIDQFRGILELVHAVEENNIFNNNKRVNYRPSIYVAGFNKVNLSYKNVLMMSEWMIERPQDLEENWYVTPCPKGVRMLVVAHQGKTKCFTKYGQFKFEMSSSLPGGYSGPTAKKSCCVLDCFYYEGNNTMYVVDFLAWNNQPMTDCDTEFRDYWLRSQFSEMPQLGVVSKKNESKFVLLPKVPCTKEELNKFMMKVPQFEHNCPSLDGLLFYHKKAHYQSGQTPLVGWLFPYMVQEILGTDVTVHEVYLAKKPKDYVDQATFIKSFDEVILKKTAWTRRPKKTTNMDTSEVKTEDQPEDAAQENGAGDTTPSEMEAEDVRNTSDKEAEAIETPIMEAEEIETPKMEAEEMPDTTANEAGDCKTPKMKAEELPDSTVRDSDDSKSPEMAGRDSSLNLSNNCATPKQEVENVSVTAESE
ncbi:snurportin-1 [Ostrinia nubilalis]|uniref:snurportin-1 n=1 Tax=Ostrinia nubilalis TaxID=29057 RepID=UPI00308233B9